jgi:hypothetical protein
MRQGPSRPKNITFPSGPIRYCGIADWPVLSVTGIVHPLRGRKAGAMASGEIGPVGDAAAALPVPKPKRTLFGPIGLVLSLVPWIFVALMAILKPG